MGRLLALKDFEWGGGSGKEDPSWWFPDAVHGSNRPYDYEAVFPHTRAIHQSIIGKLNQYTVEQPKQALRCKIRKFVERNCVGHVLRTWTGEEMDYTYIWENADPDKTKWDDKYRLIKIEHGYVVFHFEEEVDWGLFKIAFGEHCSAINDRHPGYPNVTEEQIDFAKKGYREHGKYYPDWTNR